MGKTKFVGYRHVKYVNKQNKEVEGYSLYFVEERENVVGLASYDAWVSVETYLNHFAPISVGSVVELTYNRFGSICGISNVYEERS